MLTESNGETLETSEPVAGAPVTPHTTNIVVWDIPSAVVGGEQFTIKVGIKCSDECDLTSSAFEIHDHEGTRAATGTLTGDRWPGTTGLYVVEVELEAPAAEGLYTWSVNIPSTALGTSPGTDGEIPHAEGFASFGVRVVSHPDYLVTVEAFDKESQQPLGAARVVMHPYKTVTDERGRAEVRVAKGTYTLFVSQTRYLTFGMSLEVTADMTARAELDVEPMTERN